jgi:hypothetical protein
MHIGEEGRMATTSIRIDRIAHARLKKIAEKEQSSLAGVINELLDRYEQTEFRKAVAESYARLRSDPAAWADYKRELEEWDAVLMDGLANEPPYDDRQHG